MISETQLRMILIQQMKEAVRKLKDFIQHELHNAFDTYSPSIYKRTGDTAASVYISQDAQMVGDEITAEISFLDFFAFNDSVMGQDQGYTPLLLEFGWDITEKTGHKRAFFDIHPGYHYIQKAVDRRENYGGIQVSVYVNNIHIF